MLLTAAQFREHMADEVALNDDVLNVLLDSNERAIVNRVGPLAAASETVYGRGLTLLSLRSEPLSVTSVVDVTGSTETTLTAADYRIRGRAIERVVGYWGERTTVQYVPANDAAERIVVLVQLMKCDLNYDPGILSQSGGGHFESYTSGQMAERERILDRLGGQVLFA